MVTGRFVYIDTLSLGSKPTGRIREPCSPPASVMAPAMNITNLERIEEAFVSTMTSRHGIADPSQVTDHTKTPSSI